ncbi:MAG: Spx/MgsR family RNA polymerase-binding regulatory protein [Planctomycetes bacterium]|nr:Spx/MgsR family RNA polymerase-binding regulatory protein [Planctomycetota bacterium]
MSDLTFYAYSKCSTCKKAQRWLDERDVSYTFVDITTAPPPKAILAAIAASDDYELKHLYNTSGKAYREGGYSELRKSLSEAAQLKALAGNGRLIKRPILSDGTRHTVGFKADVYEATWA